MKSVILNVVLTLSLLVSAAAPAAAQEAVSRETSNFFGVSGLLFAPSAYTIGERSVSGHAFGHERFNSFGVLGGPHERLEIGATFLDSTCGCSEDAWLLNAKLQLLKEERGLPALSVGVVDALDHLDLNASWFAVASKDLSTCFHLAESNMGLRAHLGYGAGLYDDEVFAGLELDFWNSSQALAANRVGTSLIAEYVNGNANLAVRARYRSLAATVGVFDFEDFGGGISYTHRF
ncbi:MAG: Exopolysaccharide biosynthesis protein YbjH [Armatimonadetes bacterium]|jgi:hypothetical protein|nr:Exopolysaccharide biosynthesis protein YbjH [Armatimonadota bacterium]